MSRGIPLVDQRPRNLRPDITPLVDCVFLLLVFFLLTSSFSREHGMELTTLRSGAPLDGHIAALEVLVERSGELKAEGQALTEESLAELFAREALLAQPRPIRLVTDREAPAGKVLLVMDTARSVGFETVEVVGRHAQVEAGAK